MPEIQRCYCRRGCPEDPTLPSDDTKGQKPGCVCDLQSLSKAQVFYDFSWDCKAVYSPRVPLNTLGNDQDCRNS